MTPILNVDEFLAFTKSSFLIRILISSVAAEYNERRFEKNLQIEPKRLIAYVMQIHPHHLVKSCPAATIDLPFPGDSRPRFRNPSAVPQRIAFELIRYGRTRADQ